MVCYRRILRGIWAMFCFGINLIALAHCLFLIGAHYLYLPRSGCGLWEAYAHHCGRHGFGFVEYALCLSAASISLYLIAMQIHYLWRLMQHKPLPGWLSVIKEAGLTALNPLLVSYPLLLALAEAA